MSNLLIRLDQITAQTAARFQKIDRKVSLDVVTFPDIGFLNQLEKPGQTYTAGKPKTQTSRVDGREAFKIRVLPQAVMSFAEGDARAAACHQASIDGRKTGEKGAGPFVWARRRLCDSLRLVQCILEATDPGVDIISVDSSRSRGVLLGCHFSRL